MALERKQYPTGEEAKREGAKHLVSLLEKHGTKPLLLFFSGGSCLTLLPYVKEQYIDHQDSLVFLTIGMVDERFDPIASNLVSLKETYSDVYEAVITKGATILDTTPRLHDQYEMADWYNNEIKKKIQFVKEHDGTVVAVLGMGEDGHIAGMLPSFDEEENVFYDQFLDTDRFVVGFDATGKNEFPKRFTLTIPALLQADELVVFFTGAKKVETFDLIVRDNPSIHRYPGLFLTQTKQPCSVFCA